MTRCSNCDKNEARESGLCLWCEPRPEPTVRDDGEPAGYHDHCEPGDGCKAVRTPEIITTDQPSGKSDPILLGQNPEEAQRLTYGGRPIRLLKEQKQFDSTRLAESPLFASTNLKLF